MADLIFDTSKATLLCCSESPNGGQILLPAAAINAATAVLIHKGTSESDEIDEVTVELCNSLAAAPRDVIIAWGAAGVPTTTDTARFTVPISSTIVAIDRRRLKGGLSVWAYCGAAVNDINIYCEVNRYKAVSDAAE